MVFREQFAEVVAIVASLHKAKEWAVAQYEPGELHVVESLSKVDDVKRFMELCSYKSDRVKVCVAPIPPKQHQHRFLNVLEDGFSGVIVFAINSISSMIEPLRSRSRVERSVFRYRDNFFVDEYLEATEKDKDFLKGVLEPLDLEEIQATFEDRAGSVGPVVYPRMKEVLRRLNDSRSTMEFVLRALWQ